MNERSNSKGPLGSKTKQKDRDEKGFFFFNIRAEVAGPLTEPTHAGVNPCTLWRLHTHGRGLYLHMRKMSYGSSSNQLGEKEAPNHWDIPSLSIKEGRC